MSISGLIMRLSGARSDIVSAIAAKGAEISASATLVQCASAIGDIETGGGATDFYKCASVDTTNHTWTGYKAVLSEGVYSFESAATAGLVYADGFTPEVDKIYADGALVKTELFMGNSIPQNGLVFYASLNGQSQSTAETGQGISVYAGSPSYTTHYGIPCCYVDGSSVLQVETTNIPYSTDPISFSLWLCEDKEISSEHGIMSFGCNIDGELMAIVAASSCIRLAGHGPGYGMSGVDVPITFNRIWHHIAAVLGSGSNGTRPAYVYIDGVRAASGTFAYYLEGRTPSLFIGSYWKEMYLSRIKGYLSSVRIYSRELASDEVAALAAEFTPSAS